MKKSAFVLALVIGICFLLLAQKATASSHFVIISPLSDKEPKNETDIDLKKNSAAIEVASDLPGITYFTVHPYGAPPLNPFTTSMGSSDNFTSSAYSIENLFSLTGPKPAIVRIDFSRSFSAAMLSLSGPNNDIILEIPPDNEAILTATMFPLGELAEKATLYVGNPAGRDNQIEIKYDVPTFPSSIVEPLSAWMAKAIPLDVSNRAVFVFSIYPVFLIVEIVDEKGHVSRTFIRRN